MCDCMRLELQFFVRYVRFINICIIIIIIIELGDKANFGKYLNYVVNRKTSLSAECHSDDCFKLYLE